MSSDGDLADLIATLDTEAEEEFENRLRAALDSRGVGDRVVRRAVELGVGVDGSGIAARCPAPVEGGAGGLMDRWGRGVGHTMNLVEGWALAVVFSHGGSWRLPRRQRTAGRPRHRSPPRRRGRHR